MLRGSQVGTECFCKPGAVKWVEIWFGDCVYTNWELLGFCVGLSSVFFWMIAQMPQFLSNFFRQSADALSPWFLFQWLAGDSLNLLGCLLTGDQLSTETFTAYYFIFADSLIISQYLYYQVRNKDRGYDLDESLHKPTTSGYHTVLKINSRPEPALDITSEDASPTSNSGRKQKQESKRQLALACPGNEFGILGRGERFHDFEEEKLQQIKHQVAIPPGRNSTPSNHLRRQLRRIVTEYGLEYGPPSASKLTTQQASRLSKIDLRQTGWRKAGSDKLKKVACMAGTIVAGLPGCHGFQEQLEKTNRKFLMHCDSNPDRLMWVKETGTLFGWISSGLYLGSRISQLIKNNQRKSAEGLSLAMVSCAVLANLTYGSAILIRAKSWEDLVGKAPWLLGSLGTVSLDITIFLQAQYLGSKAEEPNERTPLISA